MSLKRFVGKKVEGKEIILFVAWLKAEFKWLIEIFLVMYNSYIATPKLRLSAADYALA